MSAPLPVSALSDASPTAAEALRRATETLARAGVIAARLEARLLVALGLGVSPEALLLRAERVFGEAEQARLDTLLRRRIRHEPIAHILGEREFWSLPFRVTRDTLIPRPETETLVEAVLEHRPSAEHPSILDLGTGTGCLLLALLHERPNAHGVGVDLSDAVLAVARANAESLGLSERARFVLSSWGAGVDGRYDVVVSNPPYVRTSEIETLSPDVALFEPRLALDGGEDGLARFRELVPQLRSVLNPDGLVALEVGIGQADAVGAMLAAVGIPVAARISDLSGVLRCIIGTKRDQSFYRP